MNNYSKFSILIILFMTMLMTTGCWRPFPKPIVEEVNNNETAFLVPLEGDTSKQVKFDSVEHLDKLKVATKRVTIPVTWLKTGRLYNSGIYIPNARLIKVSRTPVARRWTASADSGTSTIAQDLEAESKDSVGVSSGFAITSYVTEEDTATYLYWFPTAASSSMGLSEIVDNQIFNACQAIYATKCSEWDVQDLRHHKPEISEAIRASIIPQFKLLGITIDPTLGLIGGLVYDNPDIQKAIDEVFISQTLEAKTEAAALAQIKQNQLDLSIEANDAAKRQLKADAEAYEITSKAKAISAGGEGYLKLLELEVEKMKIGKWNGDVPMVQSGGGGGAMPIIPITIAK